MENEAIKNLQKEIDSIVNSINDINKSLSLLKLHDQSYIKAGEGIKPGIATKVAYDNNGIIIKGSELERSDIPILSIDQVEGLRSFISITEGSKAELLGKIKEIDVVKRSKDIKETGCKVNVDENGFVISTAPLLAEDLPAIPISKIEGLTEKLDSLLSTSMSNNVEISSNEVNYTINPGTYTKITVGPNGTVTRGSKLSIDDIPSEIIVRLSELETLLPSFADRTTLNSFIDKLSGLNFEDIHINPGTYTKVTVNSTGIVTNVSELTMKDLPEIGIGDITDLAAILADKADRLDYIKLQESINSLLSMNPSLNNVNSLTNQVEGKAEKSQVVNLSNEVKELKSTINNLIDVTSLDSLLAHIKSLETSIYGLEGRISAIEFKLGLHNDFDEEVKNE